MAKEPENKTGTELEVLQRMEKAFFRNNEKSTKRNTEKSLKWFSKYIPRSMNNVRTSQMFRDRSLWTKTPQAGSMVFFEYDPKHKQTLPVYDRYPLAFFWDMWTGGNGKWGEDGVRYGIAINLHYLPPQLRAAAMIELLKRRNEKRYRKSTRLQISWDVLQAMSNSRLFEHSVKIYRMDHVRSVFVKVPPTSWEMAVFLPLGRMQKGGKTLAWNI